MKKKKNTGDIQTKNTHKVNFKHLEQTRSTILWKKPNQLYCGED